MKIPSGIQTARRLTTLWLTSSLAAGALGCSVRADASTPRARPTTLTIERAGLYPETVLYDRARDSFLVGSLREGAVYRVDEHGQTEAVVRDSRLTSVLGIAVDETRDRLWVTNSDIGSAVRASTAGPKKVAAVALYELSTGRALQYVDLTHLYDGPHLINGIALDPAGTAYLTDSFSPVIYAVDPQGNARVLLQDARFSGEGINLNGVVFHPDGYLLVVKKSDGLLFKVPIAQPRQLSVVLSDARLEAGDGLLLTSRRDLLVVTNETASTQSNAALALSSSDGWTSATLSKQLDLGGVYPTTAAIRNGRVFVLHSKLHELLQATPERKLQLAEKAVVRDIGSVADFAHRHAVSRTAGDMGAPLDGAIVQRATSVSGSGAR